MIYYNPDKRSGVRRKSMLVWWCLGLACMFAWRGQWGLHLAALAVGTADAAFVSSYAIFEAAVSRLLSKMK